MLTKDRESVNSDRVATAKDAKELGNVLLGPSGGPDAPRQLYDIFVEVMSHQVALLNGVMEGVKTLLDQLSPRPSKRTSRRKADAPAYSRINTKLCGSSTRTATATTPAKTSRPS